MEFSRSDLSIFTKNALVKLANDETCPLNHMRSKSLFSGNSDDYIFDCLEKKNSLMSNVSTSMLRSLLWVTSEMWGRKIQRYWADPGVRHVEKSKPRESLHLNLMLVTFITTEKYISALGSWQRMSALERSALNLIKWWGSCWLLCITDNEWQTL